MASLPTEAIKIALEPKFKKLYYDTRIYKNPTIEDIVRVHESQYQYLLQKFKLRDLVTVVASLYDPVAKQNEPPCPHEWFVLKPAFSALLTLIEEWKRTKDKPLLFKKTLDTRDAIVNILTEISKNCDELAAVKCLPQIKEIDPIINTMDRKLLDRCGFTRCKIQRAGSRRPRRKTRKLLRALTPSKLYRL